MLKLLLNNISEIKVTNISFFDKPINIYSTTFKIMFSLLLIVIFFNLFLEITKYR